MREALDSVSFRSRVHDDLHQRVDAMRSSDLLRSEVVCTIVGVGHVGDGGSGDRGGWSGHRLRCVDGVGRRVVAGAGAVRGDCTARVVTSTHWSPDAGRDGGRRWPRRCEDTARRRQPSSDLSSATANDSGSNLSDQGKHSRPPLCRRRDVRGSRRRKKPPRNHPGGSCATGCAPALC